MLATRQKKKKTKHLFKLKATCKGKEFEIYEINEADSVGIKAIENWRNAEIGDWICTHDNILVRVIGRRINKLKGIIINVDVF